MAEDLERRRAQRRGKYTALRLAFIESRGGRCEQCGFDDYRALQIDHVHGNGHSERLRRGPAIVYVDVWKPSAADKYQVLCANCNQIKRHERQEFGSGVPLRFQALPINTDPQMAML